MVITPTPVKKTNLRAQARTEISQGLDSLFAKITELPSAANLIELKKLHKAWDIAKDRIKIAIENLAQESERAAKTKRLKEAEAQFQTAKTRREKELEACQTVTPLAAVKEIAIPRPVDPALALEEKQKVQAELAVSELLENYSRLSKGLEKDIHSNLARLLKKFDKSQEALSKAMSKVLQEYLIKITDATQKVIDSLPDQANGSLVGLLNNLQSWIEINKEIFKPFFDACGNEILPGLEELEQKLKGLFEQEAKKYKELVTDSLPIKGSMQRAFKRQIETICRHIENVHKFLVVGLIKVEINNKVNELFSTINNANLKYAEAIEKLGEALGHGAIKVQAQKKKSIGLLKLVSRFARQQLTRQTQPFFDLLKQKTNQARAELIQVGSEAIKTLKDSIGQMQLIIDNASNLAPAHQKETREELILTRGELERLTNELETAHKQDEWNTVVNRLHQINDLQVSALKDH